MTQKEAIEIIFECITEWMEGFEPMINELAKLRGDPLLPPPLGPIWFSDEEREAFKVLGKDVGDFSDYISKRRKKNDN